MSSQRSEFEKEKTRWITAFFILEQHAGETIITWNTTCSYIRSPAATALFHFWPDHMKRGILLWLQMQPAAQTCHHSSHTIETQVQSLAAVFLAPGFHVLLSLISKVGDLKPQRGMFFVFFCTNGLHWLDIGINVWFYCLQVKLLPERWRYLLCHFYYSYFQIYRGSLLQQKLQFRRE